MLCKNKPVFLVDRAPWYRKVLSRKGLKYEIRTRGKRNAVESWIFSFIAPYNSKRCLAW